MRPIHQNAYLTGKHRLPTGAVPLVTDCLGTVICQTVPHFWIRWHEDTGRIDKLPLITTQKKLLPCLVSAFGGKKEMAEKLYISERTIEGWAQGRVPLTLKAAYDIALLLPPLPPGQDEA